MSQVLGGSFRLTVISSAEGHLPSGLIFSMYSLPSLPITCETFPEHSQSIYWPTTYQSLSDARLPKLPTSVRDPCHPLPIVPHLFQTQLADPFLQIGVIQGLPPYSQDCRRILNLPLRLRQLRPFQFRDDYLPGRSRQTE